MWQSVHLPCRCQVDSARCLACAPTPAEAVLVLPAVSWGGAGLLVVLSPWHDVQSRPTLPAAPVEPPAVFAPPAPVDPAVAFPPVALAPPVTLPLSVPELPPL